MGVVNNFILLKDLIAKRKKEMQIKVINATSVDDLVTLTSGMYFIPPYFDVELDDLSEEIQEGAGWGIGGMIVIRRSQSSKLMNITLLDWTEQYILDTESKQITNWFGIVGHKTAWDYGIGSGTGNNGQVLTKTAKNKAEWQNK